MAGKTVSIDRWNRALVTGASSGIGNAFAWLLSKNGTDLVVVARDEARLTALAAELHDQHGVAVEVLVADLGDRSQLATVAERLQSTESPIDLLVNNAGFGFSGDFIDLDPDGETSVVDVNISAMQRLAHAAGTAMSSRQRGGIINVSSVAGFGPSPKAATYAATKAFVTSFSEALHMELGPLGVVVSCLCPGLTRTEFQERAKCDVEAVPKALWQSPEEVADAGLKGLARGKAIVIPGAQNKALRAALKASPAALTRRISKAVAEANGR
ncbi:MAG: SDR family NAD(P)-dependent oxidoreductase [Acidimicrobiales bacterium]